MSDAPQATATIVTPPQVPQRAIALIGALGAVIGSGATIGGLLLTIGGWRATVDERQDNFDRRLEIVEQTQRTNLPIFAGMQKDVSYLAERARREDDRIARELERVR